MNIKEVKSLYNGKVLVDLDTKKLISYDNAKKRAIYSAKIIEDDKTTIFSADYVENEIVTDVEARLRTFGSPVLTMYAIAVNFDSDKNDPDESIWAAVVEYVREHENDFFFKNGNLKRVLGREISKRLF